LFFATLSWRPLRTSCWIVGNRVSVFPVVPARAHARAPSRSLLASFELANRRKPSEETSLAAQPGVFYPPPTPEVGRVALTGSQQAGRTDHWEEGNPHYQPVSRPKPGPQT